MKELTVDDVDKMVTLMDYVDLISKYDKALENKDITERYPNEEVLLRMLQWEEDFHQHAELLGKFFLKHMSLKDVDAFLDTKTNREDLYRLISTILLACERKKLFNLTGKKLFDKVNSLICYYLTYIKMKQPFPWAFKSFCESVIENGKEH